MSPINYFNIVSFLRHVLYGEKLYTIEIPRIYTIPDSVQDAYNHQGIRITHRSMLSDKLSNLDPILNQDGLIKNNNNHIVCNSKSDMNDYDDEDHNQNQIKKCV